MLSQKTKVSMGPGWSESSQGTATASTDRPGEYWPGAASKLHKDKFEMHIQYSPSHSFSYTKGTAAKSMVQTQGRIRLSSVEDKAMSRVVSHNSFHSACFLRRKNKEALQKRKGSSIFQWREKMSFCTQPGGIIYNARFFQRKMGSRRMR